MVADETKPWPGDLPPPRARSLPLAGGVARAGRGALAKALAARTAPAALYEGGGETLRCTACAPRCVLGAEGRVGACGVRFVRGGRLQAPFGYVARRYVRPVETNTMYHVLPGRSRSPSACSAAICAATTATTPGSRRRCATGSSSTHTRCPRCHEVAVERHNYRTLACRVDNGRCPACGEALPGLWQ